MQTYWISENNRVPCIVAPGRAMRPGDTQRICRKKRAQAQRQCSEHPVPFRLTAALPGPATLGEHRSKQVLKVWG
jgi:hypothetical protein